MGKKPIIHFRSRGPQGNIFWILGRVQRELYDLYHINAYNALMDDVLRSGSYTEALNIIRNQVDLIDDDGLV